MQFTTEINPTDFAPGMVIMPTSEHGFHRDNDESWVNLVVPPGSYKRYVRTGNPASGLNVGIREMLAKPELKWVWLMGYDHVFDNGLLLRLLDRRVDIVVPLCIRRAQPFYPVAAREEVGPGEYKTLRYLDIKGQTGLIDWHYHSGNAGMLIQRNVLETLVDPWFEIGQIWTDQLNEDVRFCEKARDAGFKVHLDLDNFLGHIPNCVVFPVRNKQTGEYGMQFHIGQLSSKIGPVGITFYPSEEDQLNHGDQ